MNRADAYGRRSDIVRGGSLLVIQRLRLWYLRRRGLNALADGAYEEAADMFRRLLAINGQDATARHNLGMAALGRDDFQEAERCFRENLDRLGDHYPRLRALADLYYVWGKRVEAGEYYRRALKELDGQGAAASTYAAAKPLIERRIANTETEAAFGGVREADRAYRAGVAAQEADDPDSAIAEFRRAVACDPSHVLAWNNLGTILMNQRKDFAGAEAAFSTGISYEPLPILQANLQKLAEAKTLHERRAARRGGGAGYE